MASPSRWLTLAISGCLVGLLVGLAACGDDDDASGPAESPEATGDSSPTSSEGETPTLPPIETDLTPEEYFTRVDEIFGEADAKTDAADATFGEQLGSAEDLEGQLAVISSYLEILIEAFSVAIGQMDVLTPPDLAAAGHDAFIDAAITAAAAASDLQLRLAEVDDPAEAEPIVEEWNNSLSQIVGAADIACLQLQGAANELGIEIDLPCG